MDGLAKILWGLAELLWTQLLHFVVKQEAAHRLNTVRDKRRPDSSYSDQLYIHKFQKIASCDVYGLELDKSSVS